MKKIIIVGTGWYGLHIYLLLKNSKYKNNIIILEKNQEIFNNSSNFNQNRLHLGYHYPRSFKTRELCIKGYFKFISKYRSIVDFIDNNYYLISKDSILDYETYIKIFNDINYQHTFIVNDMFKKIQGDIINTKEKIINSFKAKKYFEDNINKNDIKFNYNVKSINQENDKVIINNDLECDILIDCTYNQLNIGNKDNDYIFELTISLIYERINLDESFESITVMDGDFFSLFPREITKELYTLTHVKYTPLIKSKKLDDIKNYKLEDDVLENVIRNMENDVLEVYSKFKKTFKYISYFLSYKCKLLSNIDTRECNIYEDNNIISVNCGKITGIFEFEDFIREKLQLD